MISNESNVLNTNIPNLKLKVRRSWLTKKDSDKLIFDYQSYLKKKMLMTYLQILNNYGIVFQKM